MEVLLRLFILGLSCCSFLQVSSASQITIDLSNLSPNNNTLNNYYNLTDYNTQVNVENINGSIGFYIFQVHSYFTPLTLSNTSDFDLNTTVNGSNIGLVQFPTINGKQNFFISKYVNFANTVLIAVTVYDKKDPIPGGCNQVFNTDIAAYLNIINSNEMITVQSQPSSVSRYACERKTAQIHMYHMFLLEKDLNKEEYFSNLNRMLTVQDIKKHGRRVSDIDGVLKYRRFFSNYLGTGEVFAIIASDGNYSSAYIPAISYGFNIDYKLLENTTISNPGIDSNEMKYFICPLLFFFGMFLLFFGQRFFKATILLVGIFFGYVLVLMILRSDTSMSFTVSSLISIATALVIGSLWLFIWWKCGVPILSVFLTYFSAGFLISSIVFYPGIEMYNDATYYAVFISIAMGCSIILAVFTLEGHIFATTLVGSYMLIIALNYYVGANLQYILLNSVRRITLKDFKYAVTSPPFQSKDIYLIAIWLIMKSIGYLIQYKMQKGKAPFPSSRCSKSRNCPDENEPLISENRGQWYV